MHTGWLDAGGTWYFFDQDGSMHTGWLLDNGTWHYMSPDNGTMVRNTTVEGRYLDSAGVWKD